MFLVRIIYVVKSGTSRTQKMGITPATAKKTLKTKKAVPKLKADEKPKKQFYAESTSQALYWASLLILIISNLLVAVVLIPFLLTLKGFQISLLVILLALTFGAIFNMLIVNIDFLKRRHHLIALVVIPLISLASLGLVLGVSNRIADALKLSIRQEPIVISAIYIVSFLLPYVFFNIRKLM